MRESGFTLVELLITLAVISIISLVLISVATGALKKAITSEIALNLRSIATAAVKCVYTENSDPESLSLEILLSKGYLDKEPNGDYSLDAVCDTAVCTVSSIYHGDVPSPEELKRILEDVQIGDDGVVYPVRLPIW